MSQNQIRLKETIEGLCQRFSHTFGASYCGITLAAEGPTSFAAYGNHAQTDTILAATPSLCVTVAPLAGQTSPVAPPSAEEIHPNHQLPQPEPDGLLAAIADACRSAQPILRFDLHPAFVENGQGAPVGFLYLAFARPTPLTLAEVSALLAMAEMMATVLTFARPKTLEAVSGGLLPTLGQTSAAAGLLDYPFLEAKKHWIKAFEREYLGQQLAKHAGNISMVARAARISRYTVYALLNKFQLSAKSYKRKKSNGAPRGLPEGKKPQPILESAFKSEGDEPNQE